MKIEEKTKTVEVGSWNRYKVGRVSQGWPSKGEPRTTDVRDESWISKEEGGNKKDCE